MSLIQAFNGVHRLGQFLDEITIKVRAGSGGPGCISFRREKYIPRGGPDGGDGGNGGSVWMQASSRILSLTHFFSDKLYAAENGGAGQGQQKSGRAGKDLILSVPFGTQVFDPASKQLIYDLVDDTPFVLAKGGKGGKGNIFFKNSIRQAPEYAQSGEVRVETSYLLSLKLIADVGFVGFPNAGKSTLLKACTNAKPKIAHYAFTTLSPNLGYIDYDHIDRVLVADIPGILEGASQGHGLGLSFLKHIERVRLILFVLDVNTALGDDELKLLRAELNAYNPNLSKKPYLVVINKIDRVDDHDFLEKWVQTIKENQEKIFCVSALKGNGISELKNGIIDQLKKLNT